MFAKPTKASGNALLKGKDAKKLRRDVAARFSPPCDGPDDAKLQRLLPSKVRRRPPTIRRDKLMTTEPMLDAPLSSLLVVTPVVA
jgi:hypothetical protein